MIKLIFISTLLFVSSVLQAETIKIKDGVTFELSTGLISQPKQASPVVAAWMNSGNTVSVTLIVMEKNESEISASAKEFNNWPSVGLSTLKGFGNSNAKTLEGVLQAPCSFTGQAEQRDVENVSYWVSVDTTCKTAEGFNLRSRLIQILLRDAIALIRIDSNPPTEMLGEKITATIWNSIQVHPDQKAKLSYSSQDVKNEKPQLSGGKGFFLKNYKTINNATLIGTYIGAILGSIFLGMLSAFFLLKIKIKPLPALIIPQVLFIILRIYGAEENGAWELDPILYFVSSVVAIVVLWKWANRKYQKIIQPGTPN